MTILDFNIDIKLCLVNGDTILAFTFYHEFYRDFTVAHSLVIFLLKMFRMLINVLYCVSALLYVFQTFQ